MHAAHLEQVHLLCYGPFALYAPPFKVTSVFSVEFTIQSSDLMLEIIAAAVVIEALLFLFFREGKINFCLKQ
jgi:hypothetical protein